MFQRLVNHNSDLARLVERGYALSIDSTNHLVVRDIPYLNQHGELRWGAFVAKLVFIDQDHVQQDDHQVYFAGSAPYELDGTPVSNLAGGPTSIRLSELSSDVVVERSFSNKPTSTGAFTDFFHKIESYTAIVAGPAMAAHGADPLTYRVVTDVAVDPIFKFQDTLTSRAELGDLTAGLMEDVVAVIGLGGTGSYVIDFLVKARIKEIRGFDGDNFQVHNAYRAPGRTIEEEFGKSKAGVLQGRYENFRHGLMLKQTHIDSTSDTELAGVSFAFVCVDKGSSRAEIFAVLTRLQIPFIDVGMGLRNRSGGLTGQLRLTNFPPEHALAMQARNLVPMTDDPDDIYRTNIQIGELNALNAALAVIRYKQSRGFYKNGTQTNHHIFNINELKMYQEDA